LFSFFLPVKTPSGRSTAFFRRAAVGPTKAFVADAGVFPPRGSNKLRRAVFAATGLRPVRPAGILTVRMPRLSLRAAAAKEHFFGNG